MRKSTILICCIMFGLSVVWSLAADVPPPSERVTINYADALLSDVVRSLADETKLNIVMGKDITGTVTVHLVDVPLENALDSILISNGYTYVKEGELLRIIPLSDTMTTTMGMVTEVFTLKYVDADEVRQAVEKMISKDGLTKVFNTSSNNPVTSGSTASGNTANPASIYTVSSLSSTNIKPRANIIIVRDYPSIIADIKKIVRQLDKKLPQIIIEARFIEVDLTNTDKMGVDWTISAALSGAIAPMTFPFTNNRKALDPKGYFIPQPGAADTNFSLNRIFPNVINSNFSYGMLNFAQTQAVLNLLQQRKKVTLISSPRVAVVHGEEATISVGTSYPIPEYSYNSLNGQPIVSGYQEQKIGIILRVTPYLEEDGKDILMQLHPEVSEITSFVGPNNERPVVSTKEIDTSVRVHDGHTIVMGGLIKDQITTINNRVPFLGSIPILGAPFQYKSKAYTRTELLIFITPHIITTVDEMVDKPLKARDVEETYMRQLEEKQ